MRHTKALHLIESGLWQLKFNTQQLELEIKDLEKTKGASFWDNEEFCDKGAYERRFHNLEKLRLENKLLIAELEDSKGVLVNSRYKGVKVIK